jgi:hypothetical protein
MDNWAALVPEEFVAKENVNNQKHMLIDEEVNANNDAVKTANLLSPPQEESPSEAIRQGPLTFDPSPLLEDGEDIELATTNNQAKLMQWHYHLGHLAFPRLKQFAVNGDISKKLAKVAPLKGAGCLFGTMTKIPWYGKETKSSHKVFSRGSVFLLTK